jgi:hypothetical protein
MLRGLGSAVKRAAPWPGIPVGFGQRENAELGLHQYGKMRIYLWSSGRHNGSLIIRG